MKRSIMVQTPSWGEVYIASEYESDVLHLFWRNNLNPEQRMRASEWLSKEGWFQYCNGVIEMNPDLFQEIQESA